MTTWLSLATQLGPRRVVRLTRHRLKQAAAARHPWYATDDVCTDRAIIIGGCGRSGTTLLREMLNRHPRIACGAETAFLCELINPARLSVEWNLPRQEVEAMVARSPNVVRFAEEFFRIFAQREGKVRWADKTPRNIHAVHRILTWFPNATFVHIIRDGRDVACSLRHHPAYTIRNGKIVPQKVTNPIRACARRWIDDTSMGLAFRGHPRYFEICYEELVSDPESTMRVLCETIGEDYHPALVDPNAAQPTHDRAGRLINNPNATSGISASSVGRWAKDLTLTERKIVHQTAGQLLIALGYAKDASWVNEPEASQR